MSKLREKIFINVISNIVIFVLVLGVFALSFTNKIITVIGSSEYGPYYHGNENKKQVSLMINVYWGSEYLSEILDILDKHQTKVTFFVGGSWVQQNSELFLELNKRGHEIGNHGFFHKDHKAISVERNLQEIKACENIVNQFIGKKTTLFAPPSGAFSNTTLKVANELGYKTVMWSKDTIDWRDKDENLVYARATKSLKNGDLVLMHPTNHTLKALDRILTFYESQGFKQVIVSENLG